MKLIAAFLVLLGASPLLADECGLLCDKNFWISADAASVQAEIDAGADIDARDSNGMTALFLSLHLGSPDTTKLLLEAGADVNARNDEGLTPLHFVNIARVLKSDLYPPSAGYLAKISLLLAAGAEVNALSNDGVSVLYLVVSLGVPEAVEILVKAGIDVDATPNGDWTALHVASASNAIEGMIAPLLDGGANVNARRHNGTTALHTAVVFRPVDAVKFLLDAGADVDAISNNGDTALMSAASVSSGLENLVLLIAAGADVNIVRADGWTALHSAALEGGEAALRLLEAGADGTLENADGDTPFDLIKDDEGLMGGAVYLALEAASRE